MTVLDEIELVPGELTARVYAHEIGPTERQLSCWSIVSEGLRTKGQKEVVFTIRRDASDPPNDYPRDPLHLLTLINGAAHEGRLVGVGGYTGLSNGQLGRSDLTGIVYGRQELFEEVPLPNDSIAGILVTADELDVAIKAGAGRILARLGRLHGWFPNPPFTDFTRRPVAVVDETRGTVLGATPQIRRPSTIGLDGDVLSLRLPPLEPGDLRGLANVPRDRAIAFVAAPAAGSRPRLVWEVGQQQREAIGLPGADVTRMTGHFVAITPGRRGNEVVFSEDGFGVFLKPQTYAALRASIQRGEPFSAKRRAGEYDFSVLTGADTETTALDDLTSVRARVRAATTDALRAPGSVELRGVVLLTAEEEIERSVTASELASYAASIHTIAERFFSERPRASGLDVRVHVRLERQASLDVHLDVRGAERSPDVDSTSMQGLANALRASPAPDVRGPSLEFEVLLTVWDGSGLPFPDQNNLRAL